MFIYIYIHIHILFTVYKLPGPDALDTCASSVQPLTGEKGSAGTSVMLIL